MMAEVIFHGANFTALPFWLLMIAAPEWRVTKAVMESFIPIIAFCAVYVVLVLPGLPALLPVLAKPDLTTIAALLGTPEGTALAWLHFVAFDLFAGRWEYLDAQERGVSHWLLGPCLFLTLMLGPLGLLCYLGARTTGK